MSALAVPMASRVYSTVYPYRATERAAASVLRCEIRSSMYVRGVFVIDVEARYVRTVGAAGNCGVYDVKIEHLGIAVFDGAAQLRGTKIVLGAAQYQGRGVFGVGKQALSFCLYVIFCGQYLLDLDNSN